MVHQNFVTMLSLELTKNDVDKQIRFLRMNIIDEDNGVIKTGHKNVLLEELLNLEECSFSYQPAVKHKVSNNLRSEGYDRAKYGQTTLLEQ